jgi:hypothetical protein
MSQDFCIKIEEEGQCARALEAFYQQLYVAHKVKRKKNHLLNSCRSSKG